MNIKEFFKKWKKGVMSLTPRQVLKSKLRGQIGTMVGVVFASIMMAIRMKMWYWLPAMGFMIFLQILDFISTKQQYNQIVEMDKIMEENENGL